MKISTVKTKQKISNASKALGCFLFLAFVTHAQAQANDGAPKLPNMICPNIVDANILGLATTDYQNEYPDIEFKDYIHIEAQDDGTYELEEIYNFSLYSAGGTRQVSQNNDSITFHRFENSEFTYTVDATFTKADSSLEVRVMNYTYLLPIQKFHYEVKCRPETKEEAAELN